MNPILKKPIINEKFSKLNEVGVYGFVVDKNANKISIGEAIEKTYGVSVEKVRTINVIGKVKNRMTRARVVSGRKPGYKKAIVTLKKGDVIDYFNEI